MTDRAGFLSAPAVAQLDRKLGDYARGTGHQVLVYIDHTTGGLPIEDWAVKAFERWRVGRKGIDDGLVLFVFSDDRRVRIEVGYGLEPIMPDTRASRIIREAIVPRIQAGDRDGAVAAGVDAILSALGGAGQPGQAGEPVADSPEHKISPKRFGIGLVGLLVVLFVLLRVAVTHPGLAWLLTTMIGSGRGGGRWGGGGGWGGGGFGGGGGGGGFSGGGGRSGGGGASGSW